MHTLRRLMQTVVLMHVNNLRKKVHLWNFGRRDREEIAHFRLSNLFLQYYATREDVRACDVHKANDGSALS